MRSVDVRVRNPSFDCGIDRLPRGDAVGDVHEEDAGPTHRGVALENMASRYDRGTTRQRLAARRHAAHIAGYGWGVRRELFGSGGVAGSQRERLPLDPGGLFGFDGPGLGLGDDFVDMFWLLEAS